MAVATKRDDVIHHWLSKVGSRNGSTPFTQRNNSSNTTNVDDPCCARNKDNEYGSSNKLDAKIKQAPHTDHDGPLPPLRPQHCIASVNGIRKGQDAIPGMQSWNNTPGWQYLPNAHATVPNDGEKRVVDVDLSHHEKALSFSPTSWRQLQFTSLNDAPGPRGTAAEMPGSGGDAAQSPWSVSPPASIANRDSGNPSMSSAIPRGIYDRRPRHKTRPDRYELKATGPSMMPSSSRTKAQKPSAAKRRRANGVIDHLPKDSNNPSFPPASGGANEKQEVRKGTKRKKNIFEENFKAPNVTQDRLSLPVKRGPGLFHRSRTGHSGVPDLSFSGMAFLSDDVRRPADRETAKHSCTKSVREANGTDGGISRYFSKQPAGPSMPNHYSTEKDVPQRLSRQPDNLLLNPAVGARSAGTADLAADLAASLFAPNAIASTFREAGASPSDSTSNPLWGHAKKPTHWLPQVRFRMLGARHAMLMAAKTARNISMLDRCRKAVQHAARMVSHEARGRIDTEVERDYPISNIVSGFPFQETNCAIEEMIRGENQFLAEVCAVFDPGYKDFGDSSDEANAFKVTASSVNGMASPDINPHVSGPSTRHNASDNNQNLSSSPEISGSLKAAQNNASNPEPCLQSEISKAAHTTSCQPGTAECNGSSETVPTPVSYPTPNNHHLPQAKSGDNVAPGSKNLPALIPEPQNEPNMSTEIRVINHMASNELNNMQPFNHQSGDGNTARHVEQNTGNMQPSLVWSTSKPLESGQPEIETSSSSIFNNLGNKKEAGSVTSGVQNPDPIGAERTPNCHLPPQPPLSQPLYSDGPNVLANPLATNAGGHSRNVIWHTEQMGSSPQLSTNYPPYDHGGNRPASPALSIRSEFSHQQNFDSDWICESYPESLVEHHLQLVPSFINTGHRYPNLPHATASSPIPRSIPTASGSNSTIPPNTPWHNNQTKPWALSYAHHYAQPILNSHLNFTNQDLFPKSDKFASAPPSSLPFSQPNKLH
ncbi:hypothetical protein AJ78_06070 [Emergomyces pasteurianus Ep9510]|uniref:Uncharacterized protein n=1 Tax=Emergomyces pasteurianus Ep9510 TaxID=1447872 RepID=A0A1J9PAE3_9EURO|nr:hypothetical protein AJ78_06070 [Emergomyces pasteurianus Ep9510]